MWLCLFSLASFGFSPRQPLHKGHQLHGQQALYTWSPHYVRRFPRVGPLGFIGGIVEAKGPLFGVGVKGKPKEHDHMGHMSSARDLKRAISVGGAVPTWL